MLDLTLTRKGDRRLTRIIRILVVVFTVSVLFATVSVAHFGMIIPSKDVVGKDRPSGDISNATVYSSI